MNKKIVELVDAFENLRFQQCIRTSDQILKKIQKSDGKKKVELTAQQFMNLYLCRIGSFASTGQLHEANELISKEPIISQSSSFLFLQICSLALDRRTTDFITTISQNKQKKNIDINRFILVSNKFSQLSRIFLRKFATSNNNSDSITQIYLEYLHQLDSKKMINYKRDRIIIQAPNLQFKFVSMFLDNFIKKFSAVQNPKQHVQKSNYNKIRKAIADLKLKIAIHQGNSGLVRKYFPQYQKQISDNIFVYLRSLKNLSNQKQSNEILWRQQFLKIFRENLNLDNYRPIYDFSLQFITQIFTHQDCTNFQLTNFQILPIQQLYIFKDNVSEQMLNYINSLYTEYCTLKQKQKQNKKKDYYKISLKNSLLLLMQVSGLLKKYEQSRKFLIDYKQQYGKKLTFPEEIAKYMSNPSIFTEQFKQQYRKSPSKIENDEDKLIWMINYQRMYARNPLKYTLAQNYNQWERLHELYLTNMKEVEKEKKLEKGQRYLSDQFLLIEADSVRKYTEQATHQQLSQKQREELYFYILGQLEDCIGRSPYNHDNKLRTIFYMNKLNYYEQSLRLLQSLDIKAVQFQTLGYWHFKSILNFNAWDSNEHLLNKIVRSYQENYREASQYAYKSLLGVSFNECEQNLCYFNHINRSYNYLILLYTLYLKNFGKNNCQFYLKQILARINQHKQKRLTLNADFRIMRNIIDDKCANFVDFYGIFNNLYVLQYVCRIKLLINAIGKESQQYVGELRKNIGITGQFNLRQVYDFSEYEIFDKKLQYKFSGEQLHNERVTAVQLKLLTLVNKISLNICDFVLEIRKQGNNYIQLHKNIIGLSKQLNQSICKLPWRQQVLFLPTIRFNISQMISVLANQLSLLTSKNKKIQNQKQKKQLCEQLINILIECVSDGVKIAEQMECDKKYNRQIFVQRDNLLNRVTKMTSAEYKKLYKLKL